MKVNLKNLAITAPLLFSSVTLFLHGYLGYFVRYIADDFCSAYRARHLGVLRAAWFWYLTWTGRYSASVLDGVIGWLGPGAISFIVLLTIIIWLLVLTALFMFFFSRLKNRFLVSLALATTTLFALFLLAPDIRGALYWGQGMRSVIPPLIMGTIQVILVNRIRAKEWTKLQRILWGILGFFWALVAGGFSETYAAFQVAALLFSLLVALIREKNKFSITAVFLASGLLGAIGALLIVVLAPGNSERQAFFPPSPDLLNLLIISLKSFLVYGANLAYSPEKVLAIFGLFSLAAIIGSQLQLETDARLLIITLSLTVGFTFICFLPAAYGLSDAPPNRTLILPTYFFLIGLLASGIVSGNLLRKKQSFAVSTLLPSLVIVTIIISASINSINLYQSRSEFIEYARLWDETDAMILKSKQDGIRQVIVPVIQNWASINTPNDNPKFWVNVCMSDYYDVQIIATNIPSPEVRDTERPLLQGK